MSKYMYQNTKLPSYLPMPRFLMNLPISNTAKLLYTQLLGKAQLSQKNAWIDAQGRVYFIYPIHQMAVDMDKSITTIKPRPTIWEKRVMPTITSSRMYRELLSVRWWDSSWANSPTPGSWKRLRRKQRERNFGYAPSEVRPLPIGSIAFLSCSLPSWA